jgi:hypothetical protein
MELMRGGGAVLRAQGSKHFFLKKEAKTFANLRCALLRRVRLMSRSFCFFFQKEVLAY